MKKISSWLSGLFLLVALPVLAGEYHSLNNNVCYDCHTMHFSMQHNWDGTTPVPTTPSPNGNWLGTTGPNEYLLKMPVDQLCLACHDGQGFAPDVLGTDFNAGSTGAQGRSAGTTNEVALGSPHEEWKGHTLGSTVTPPGWNPAAVGAAVTWYTPANGLGCTSCHAQHGNVAWYRNLGPYALGANAANFRPSYVLGTTNDPTKDAWVNIASPYTAGTGAPATFGPYYDQANVSFNRTDPTTTGGTTLSSNRLDTFCGACHGDFHGGPGDSNIGASAAVLDGFIRHPTGRVTLGAAGAQGYGGHSSLSRYVAATTKVRVYANDRTGYTDAAPGCVSCHKAHGNQNPFGLFFLSRNATSVNEQGGYATAQLPDFQYSVEYRNLCGQCHSQGN